MSQTRGNVDQAELIKLAIAGIDAQIRELQQKRVALEERVTAGVRPSRTAATRTSAATPGSTPKKRVFSAATRKRLSLAAKLRWARSRAAKKGKAA